MVNTVGMMYVHAQDESRGCHCKNLWRGKDAENEFRLKDEL